MKVAVVVGTRPEIVKMAPIVRCCKSRRVDMMLIHTGQHYSFEMDGVFFRELRLPEPDVNLRVGSGTHAEQISAILRGLDPVLAEARPDVVLVEGDTNSVLAAAIGAAKRGILVGHVEAGLRSYDRRMPEETNRIAADHLSDVLFAPTQDTKKILLGEGVDRKRIFVTGNTVVDELELQRPHALRAVDLGRLGLRPNAYIVATAHRPENVDDPRRLVGVFRGILGAARALGIPAVVPLHPRTRKNLEAAKFIVDEPIRVLPPLGYLEFLGLQAQASLILTDSGGVQEEACSLRVPCVTMRDSTERPESVSAGANVLAGVDPKRIVRCAEQMIQKKRRWRNPFGDGHAADKIMNALRRIVR